MKLDKKEILAQARAKEQEYKNMRKAKLDEAKAEPNRFKRFVKICCHYAFSPFVWLWHNIRDWRTFVIFAIVFLIVSCEVWVPALLAFIFGVDTALGQTMIGVAMACWSFWLLPMTPFLMICIVLTMLIKAVFDKIRFRKVK